MRKPIEIDQVKSGSLFKYCHARARHLDVCFQVTITSQKIVALKGVAEKIIVAVLADCEQADREINLAPEEKEATARAYLLSLIH